MAAWASSRSHIHLFGIHNAQPSLKELGRGHLFVFQTVSRRSGVCPFPSQCRVLQSGPSQSTGLNSPSSKKQRLKTQSLICRETVAALRVFETASWLTYKTVSLIHRNLYKQQRSSGGRYCRTAKYYILS